MHVLIVGDSHAGPLERGRRLMHERGEAAAGIDWRIVALGTGARMNTPFWADGGDHALLVDARYRRRLGRIPPEGRGPQAVGLAMPLGAGRVLRGVLRDAIVPFELPDGNGREAVRTRRVSTALFRRIVIGDMAPSLRLAVFLRDLGHTVFVIEPPGIFRDYRYLIKAPSRVVLALQARVRAIQGAELAAAGLPVVGLPEDATDAEGFMRRAWRHEDPTDTHHANAEFGAVMLARIAGAGRELRRPAGCAAGRAAEGMP